MAAPIVLVGSATGTPATNISAYVDFATLSTEDTGNQADDTASLEVLDKALTLTDLVEEGRIKVTQDGLTRFNGFMRTIEPAWEGLSRRFRVSAIGISFLLDKCIIPPARNAYVRNNGESDKARIEWLLDTFGGPFLTAGSSDFTYIQVLDTRMQRQNFANMTLRQAIERVLGAASESANYYVDTLGKLHTWDLDNEEPDTAPFKIKVATSLASDEVAPSGLRVTRDTSELTNYYYVRGQNASGSGPYSNAASITAYGRRQAFIDGPDSDTVKKGRRLGKAALKDTKDPILRAGFAVELDYCENGLGEIWRPGQKVTVTSAAHDMTNHVLRIVRVTTSYLNGLGDRRMDIEAGALRNWFLPGPLGGSGGAGGAPGTGPTGVLGGGPRGGVAGGGEDGPGAGYGPSERCGCPVDLTMYVFDDFDRTAASDLGDLPLQTDTAAWFPGGNPWTANTDFLDSWGTDGSSAYFESDTPNGSFDCFVDVADGNLPMAVDAWELLIRYRLTTASIPADTGDRYVFFQWGAYPTVNAPALVLDFSNDSAVPTGTSIGEGIGLMGVTDAKLVKSLGVGQWNLVRWQFDGIDHRARVWADGDDEPVTWDVEVAWSAPATEELFIMAGLLGNNGGTAQRFEVDSIMAGIPAGAGELVEKRIAHGSGGVIDVGEAYEPGTLTVKVDDSIATPDSWDPPAGTADMGAALYHDPDNHPDGCAKVVVTYRKA